MELTRELNAAITRKSSKTRNRESHMAAAAGFAISVTGVSSFAFTGEQMC